MEKGRRGNDIYTLIQYSWLQSFNSFLIEMVLKNATIQKPITVLDQNNSIKQTILSKIFPQYINIQYTHTVIIFKLAQLHVLLIFPIINIYNIHVAKMCLTCVNKGIIWSLRKQSYKLIQRSYIQVYTSCSICNMLVPNPATQVAGSYTAGGEFHDKV